MASHRASFPAAALPAPRISRSHCTASMHDDVLTFFRVDTSTFCKKMADKTFYPGYPLVSTFTPDSWAAITNTTGTATQCNGGTFTNCFAAACRPGRPTSKFLPKGERPRTGMLGRWGVGGCSRPVSRRGVGGVRRAVPGRRDVPCEAATTARPCLSCRCSLPPPACTQSLPSQTQLATALVRTRAREGAECVKGRRLGRRAVVGMCVVGCGALSHSLCCPPPPFCRRRHLQGQLPEHRVAMRRPQHHPDHAPYTHLQWSIVDREAGNRLGRPRPERNNLPPSSVAQYTLIYSSTSIYPVTTVKHEIAAKELQFGRAVSGAAFPLTSRVPLPTQNAGLLLLLLPWGCSHHSLQCENTLLQLQWTRRCVGQEYTACSGSAVAAAVRGSVLSASPQMS